MKTYGDLEKKASKQIDKEMENVALELIKDKMIEIREAKEILYSLESQYTDMMESCIYCDGYVCCD